MIPILYSTVTEGSVPNNYGIGALSDAIRAEVTEQRNGGFELSLTYTANGIHASEIQPNRIIKAKPNFTDNPQLFRIYKVGKTINGQFEVNAQHISYDLSGKIISSGSAGSCVAACSVLQAKADNFTITTDINSSHTFAINEPSSVRSWFGGKAGSLLDIFGGEWKYDNYTATLKQNRGSDRGVRISYGKNLIDLSQELDMENLCTGVVPYCIDSDGFLTIGTKVSTGLILDVSRDKSIDFSSDVDFESSTPIATQLANLATNYVNNNNLVTVKNSITLDFVQLGSIQDRVDLCDTVHIYFEALGISATTKCIETVWDVLEERYTSTTFGDTRTNITDTILEQQKEVALKPTSSMVEQAVDRATKLITGNLGGYVVIHDSDNDGEPDEILIMDTNDISTATKVWRWNKNGLGYSSTGYAGTYGLAMTANGEIVADFVTTGTMAGNRVRTGLIASTNNQLQIDLDAGTITAPSITLNGEDVESTLDSLVQTSVVTSYALSNSGTTIPSTFPLSQPTQPTEQQPYLWSKTVYTYANGQSNTSYGVSVRGNNGTDGQDGAGLEIKGNYDTMADLIAAHPTGSAGDAYLVGTDLVVWNTQTSSWENVGRIQGPSGADGLWLAIDNDDDGTNANVTYTAHLIKGLSTDVTTLYNSIFTWYMVKESGVTELASDTDSITVARDSADYGGTIRCVCIADVNEEPMQDYSYVTIQDYSGNDITIIAANNVKLIGESALYKPYAISSQFQVLSDEISARVTQTDFNSLSGTVTTQGTLIQQNASAILLKADTSTVNTQLNGKMGTDMSNRSSSILIDSGQIRFDSNSLVVNSSQFTLDASGNAVFKGKLNAAELYIGGEYVGLGDAIDDAESSAISAAATDATNKANNAQNNAINAAASDATTKANNAKSEAISTAATDATNKANNALTSANNYTDTGLATKVGNTEIRTKFAADTHSITIQSGTIAFTSNTLSVNATNLQITNDGKVTSNYFKAKNQFTIINADNGTEMGYLFPYAQGGALQLNDSTATGRANLFVTANGGLLYLYNSSGTLKIVLDGSNGNANFGGDITASGKITGGSFGAVASTGAVSGTSLSTTGSISGGAISGSSLTTSGNINATGNIYSKAGVTVTNASNQTRVSNWIYEDAGMVYVYNSNGDRNVMLLGYNGHVSCVQVDQSSSRKVKKNIKPIEDAEKILLLDAVSFDYIDESRGTDQRGFIAEDVAEILPNLVTPETEETTASLNYIGMIPYLQDIIKKQEKRIQALEEKLNAIMEEKEK
jgi:phage minor structural protein